MSKIRTYLRNLVANWIGYAANLVLSLVTSWFVFHQREASQRLVRAYAGQKGWVRS